MPPPSQADLEALAERALAHVDGEGQATAWWERRACTRRYGMTVTEGTRVGIAVVREQGTGQLITDRLSDEDLRAAAAGARALAAVPGRRKGPYRLPDPEPGRAHDGYDPSAAALDAEQAGAAVAALPRGAQWTSSAAKTAIASTRGVRAYEQRSFAA